MKLLTLSLSLFALLLSSGCDLLSSGDANASTLEVLSVPDGATVEVDGVVKGTTSCTMTGLSAGKHLLVVRKEGFKPVHRTISLLANGRTVEEVKLEPEFGLVLIRSTPEGASIELNGSVVGETPLLLPGIPMGTHKVLARLDGYTPMRHEFVVDSQRPKSVELELDSNSGVLVVETEPSGAAVFVNGSRRGVTPLSLDRLVKGEHAVRLDLEGHRSWSGTVTVTPKMTERLKLELVARPGTFKAVSEPRKAKIYIDDVLAGETPVYKDQMKPGTYQVRAELRGHATVTRSIRIDKGEDVLEEFKLEQNSGTLSIITEPAGVKVYVDGNYEGMTRRQGTDAISEPLRIDMLSHGFHQLKLVRKGYTFAEKNFAIQKNQVTTLQEKLERQFIPNTLIRTGDGPNDVITGLLLREHPNGDIRLEVKEGIFHTVRAVDIISVEPLIVNETVGPEDSE